MPFDKRKAKMGHLDEIMGQMDSGESEKIKPKPKGSLVPLNIKPGEKKANHGALPKAPELPAEKEELDDEHLKKLLRHYMGK